MRRGLFIGVVGILTLALPALADAPSGRYTFPTNGTVYDTRTKLTWQRMLDDVDYTQSAAVSYCTSLSLDGTGWRLPSVDELLTLIDPTKYSPAIDQTAFPGANTSFTFWSSTLGAGPAGRAWGVYFSNGASNRYDVTTKTRARCVR